MKRAFDERRRTRNIQKQFEDFGWGMHLPLGYFRKSWRRGGCLKARCIMCHFSKIFKFAPYQEERESERWLEELAEAGFGEVIRKRHKRMRWRINNLRM
ncbi:MAG: hypothetical protein NTW14_11315 [bacterium]|nr:hypothetical protein [bacterium]